MRDQCAAAGVAYYLKQAPDADGKVISKPYLDGRQWLDMPGGGCGMR
jgi:protein gp37